MTEPTQIRDDAAARRIRRVLLTVIFLGLGGLGAELLLIDHFEDWKQIIPLAVLGLSATSIIWVLAHPSPMTLRVMRNAMIWMAIAGVLGMAFHFMANTEFQIDIDPTISRWDLFWKSLRATAPPALAPGAMVLLALVGWAYTLDHPALRRTRIDPLGESS